MKKIIFILSLSCIFSQDAFNVQMLGFLGFGQQTSDITGFSQDGREIAVIGLQNATAIVDVTNPENPYEIDRIPGGTSIWRDLKYWDRHVYIGTEANDGIKVVSVDDLDAPELVNTITSVDNSHNIHIDADGYLYIIGADTNDMWIYSLEDPANPEFTGAWNGEYLHDIEVYNNKVYGAAIYTGLFHIIDVSDKTNPTTLVSYNTGGGYISTHDCAVTFDEQYLITGDESTGGHIKIWDISDYNNINLISEYFTPDWVTHSAHNVYIQESTGLLVMSYYADGTRFVDISDPANPVEVGYYDTSEIEGLYVGNWGTYVDLPSGNIISSDIETGLYILKFGGITINHTPISDQLNSDVNFNAEVLSAGGDIVDVTLHTLINNQWSEYGMSSIGNNNYSYTLNLQGESGLVQYYVSASDNQGDQASFPQQGEIMFVYGDLPDIYVNDFESSIIGWDLGIDGDSATAGIWELADPNETTYLGAVAQPENDHSSSGVQCLITGNGIGEGVGFDDVDNGETTVLSPTFDLSDEESVLLTYYRWYTNNVGDNPSTDQWVVEVSNNNGISWVELENTTLSNPTWKEQRYILDDYIDLTSQIRFRFIAEDAFYDGDTGTGGSIVEAGLDDFMIESISPLCSASGDLNDDSELNVVDIVLLINLILDPETVNSDNLCVADVNQDAELNVLDVVLIVNDILDIN